MDRPNHLVTLFDGRRVSSSSEEWRHECEARYVAAKSSAEERRTYIDHIRARRGEQAAAALHSLYMRIRKDQSRLSPR